VLAPRAIAGVEDLDAGFFGDTAKRETLLDRRSHGAAIGLGLPGHGSAGRPASVGAVEAEANGANQLPHGLKGWIREAPPPSSQTT
jgi:hypothetical protein